jgi:hypothetical protein
VEDIEVTPRVKRNSSRNVAVLLARAICASTVEKVSVYEVPKIETWQPPTKWTQLTVDTYLPEFGPPRLRANTILPNAVR